MISEMDDDGSDTIGYVDFLKWMTHKILNRGPKKTFRLLDGDVTGKIPFKHFKRAAKELGERMTDDDLQEMIDGESLGAAYAPGGCDSRASPARSTAARR